MVAWMIVLAIPLVVLAEEEPDRVFDDIFDEEFDEPPAGYPDPIEPGNRGVFAFNRQMDRWLLDPITRGYRFAVPKPGRDAISRFFLNLGSTKVLVNDLLQLEWKDASVTTGRLVINTTLGIAGFFDPAARMGLTRHESDFGQTLALAGTPSGAFVIIPVLGPATVRDGVGTVVDGVFQPAFWLFGPVIGTTELLIFSGGSGLSARDRHYQKLKALEESSVDFYAALRSAYFQDRVEVIWGRRFDHRTTGEPGLTAPSTSTSTADDGDPLFDEE
jgi:phospholipid-binding lipoprotein MlaA